MKRRRSIAILPAGRSRQEPRRVPRQRAQAGCQRRAAHPVYVEVARDLERRLRRLEMVLAPNQTDERPTHARYRAELVKHHGLESYRAEYHQKRSELAMCRRAQREGWRRVPAGVESALAEYHGLQRRVRAGEHDALRALWRTMAEIRGRLFEQPQTRS